MPAALLSQSSARTANKSATHKSRATSPTKKRRVVRRRRRAGGEPDSDDEIEREAASDSDTGDDDASSTDSVSDDSDTEPASEDAIPHDRTHLPTPRNSKSPESVVKDEGSHLNGGVPSFFTAPGNWSEMVADEGANGPADLPVIDFSDFQGHTVAPARPVPNSKKAAKSARPFEAPATQIQSAPIDSHEELTTAEPNSESNGSQSLPNRSSGQSAREAYQRRLETDPSYVPTIGNFWGHDDRLIDADLRSLSGWWRGRGRGRVFGMRGRGGFQGVQSHSDERGETPVADDPEVPPIERQWGHDGFEDMKRREEQRRAQLVVRQEDNSPKRGTFNGARGSFTPTRGRGFPRGGFSSPIRPRNTPPFTSSRIRFQMKPELMWTKQHEAYLYFDPTLKPRPGQGTGFRIKMPGHQMEVVRTTLRARSYPMASTSQPLKEGSEIGGRHFVVRVPKRADKEKADDAKVTSTVPETPIEHVFTVRPELATVKPVPTPEASTSAPAVTTDEAKHLVEPSQPVPQPEPEAVIRSQLEQLSLEPRASDPERLAKTEQAVLRNPPNDNVPDVQVPETTSVATTSIATTSIAERPILPPLQTVFTPPPTLPQPVAQPSPAYGSPYGYPLPLGIGMDPHGMPFELATGRPVYLQPPPTMYNPRPLLHTHMAPGMPFVPGHMHHSSAVSPDFLSQPPSHTPPMNGFIDPSTGTPIFSFPRQTSRIEIRAPMEETPKPPKSTASRVSSSLRTTAPSFQPSRSSGNVENGYYHPSTHPEGNPLPSYDPTNGVDDSVAGMMGYPTYQQSYYYPEPYGYPQYVDMSQAGQYDVYNMDNLTPQGTVYY